MKAYLKAYDLRCVVETSRNPPLLANNLTVAQMKNHSEVCTKRFKALTCIHSTMFDVIFMRFMAYETAKEAWNLIREFEVLRMKDSEIVKRI